MTLATFTWRAGPDFRETVTPAVRRAQFGDGYSQRVANGLNAQARRWNVAFSRPAQEIAAIRAFLQTHAGTTAFYWTPPAGPSGKWLCKQWTLEATQTNVQALHAEFEEVFE